MLRIYPVPAEPGHAVVDDDESLAAAYAYPDLADGRAWVRANMLTSLDGAVQGPDGRSGSLSPPADRRLLGLLRALADVVLAGAGTVRAEGYGPAEVERPYTAMRARAGQPPAPPIAVVSRSLDLDPEAALFTDAAEGRRTIVLTVDAAPADKRAALAKVADVEVVGDTSVDAYRAIRALADRGLQRILCEGGPHLLAHLVEVGGLDELCYTVAPMIAGGRSARMVETPRPLSSDWGLGHIIEDHGALLTRWVRK